MIVDSNYMKIVVLSVRGLNAQVRAIRFTFVEKDDSKKFTFQPGSFVMISVPGYGESPLTITTSPSQLPEFEIAVKTQGNNTTALNRLKAGDTAYIRGPLGNAADFEGIYGRELVLIGGGIGIAPLRSIIHHLLENPKTVSKLTIIHGAKTPEALLFKDEISMWAKNAEIHLVVDKGDTAWEGEVGNIPKSLDKISIPDDASVIVCGPPVIYPLIIKVLGKKKIKDSNIFLMLERKMHCGIGKCQHCTCGDKYVCTDGPTFRYSEIKDNWEALQ
jgi:sulfhydrogenase subunit gamma (sulfur reductase)